MCLGGVREEIVVFKVLATLLPHPAVMLLCVSGSPPVKHVSVSTAAQNCVTVDGTDSDSFFRFPGSCVLRSPPDVMLR